MKRFLALFIGTFFATTLVALPAASSTPTASPAHLSASDASEIATSYQHLTSDYYKRVDPQTVLTEVRAQLLAAMRTAGIPHASLPVMKASDASGTNLRSIDREVELASAQAHAKFTTHEFAYLALDAIMRSVGDRYTVFLTPKSSPGSIRISTAAISAEPASSFKSTIRRNISWSKTSCPTAPPIRPA